MSAGSVAVQLGDVQGDHPAEHRVAVQRVRVGGGVVAHDVERVGARRPGTSTEVVAVPEPAVADSVVVPTTAPLASLTVTV